jgi:hypothetical protein
MFDVADITFNKSRDGYYIVFAKDLCENGVYRYTVLDTVKRKYMFTFLPKGLYKKVG